MSDDAPRFGPGIKSLPLILLLFAAVLGAGFFWGYQVGVVAGTKDIKSGARPMYKEQHTVDSHGNEITKIVTPDTPEP